MEVGKAQVLARQSRPGPGAGEGFEKGTICAEEFDIVLKISQNNESTITSWYFGDECVSWYPRMTPTNKVSAFLDSLSSLRQEGTYCYRLKQWRRFYVTTDGIVINLVEDVPEAGGWFVSLLCKVLTSLRSELHLVGGAGHGEIFGMFGPQVPALEPKSSRIGCRGWLDEYGRSFTRRGCV
jgi:hypothetical protein